MTQEKSSEKAPSLVYFPPLRKKLEERQEGIMKVGSQVLELLSKGIYSAPENSLKEVISNSFDADASKVTIKFFRDQNKLEISDDGEGMDYVDFDEHFAFISRSGKREQGEVTKGKRPIIGKIGIGFIAVSELCDIVRVFSSKRGSDSWFEAEIDFKPFRVPEARRKEFYEVSRYTLTNHAKANPKEHYTRLVLEGLTPQFKDILLNHTPDEVRPIDVPRRDFSEVLEKIDFIASKGTINIRRKLGPFWAFLLNLANIIPVPYANGGPIRIPNKASPVIRRIATKLEDYNFSVEFDGLDLRKPVRLPIPENGDIAKEGQDFDVFPISYSHDFEDGSKLRLAGYMYNQRKRIPIEEWRGVVIRIRNTSIGGPDPGFMAYPYPGEKLFFPWTYGEIYVEEGLEEAMNIDRSSFKVGHPHYRQLVAFLHEFLHGEVFRHAKDRYVQRMDARAKREETWRERSRSQILEKAFGKALQVVTISRSNVRPVDIVPQRGRIIFYKYHPLFEGLKRTERELLEDILIAFEAALAQAEGNLRGVREQFWKYLASIFRKKP
jgi:hypothetical protein